MFGRLTRWAGPRDLLALPGAGMLTVYHDDPELTAADRLRISVCLAVPEGTPVDGEVGSMVVDGGKYGVLGFRLGMDEYQAAWDYVFGRRLPDSGYQPDDRPCFESYVDGGDGSPDGKHTMEIRLPVKPA